MALAAALMTAFYMTRLMVMTFHGENRSGEKERQHLREVSPVMWVPLAVLAMLSVVGGWINVPAAIGNAPVLGWLPHSEWLHEWLHPVTEVADGVAAANAAAPLHSAPFGGGEVLWAVLSFGLAVTMIAVAAAVVGGRRYRPAEESPPARGFTGVLYNKWYVDEIYDTAIVKPILAVSRGLARFVDTFLIDGIVNGVGQASRAFGWVGSRLQTGQVNSYAFALVAGVLILIALVVLQ
jgi:NADH-quinone oxidoreductase subunit L